MTQQTSLRPSPVPASDSARHMRRALAVLSFDSLAALVAGCCTILAAPLLSAWYGWPEGFTRFVGAVNISYGCYSGLLALRLHRKARLARWTVVILIAANTMWAAQCFTQVWWLGGDASYLGRAHLIFEGLFVGGLAYVETRIVLPYAK